MLKLKAFDKTWFAWRTFNPGSELEAGMVGVAVQKS